MGALLALVPFKDWLYGGLLVAAAIFCIHEHHKIVAEGVAEQKAADDKASAALVQQTAKQTAELQAKATMAEQAYDKELQSIANQPSVGAVRLCVNSHNSGSGLPKAGTTNGGNAAPGAASGNVQPVSPGDSSGGAEDEGVDIGPLLSALAAAADREVAVTREFQARE
jgi:hypothetical protein